MATSPRHIERIKPNSIEADPSNRRNAVAVVGQLAPRRPGMTKPPSRISTLLIATLYILFVQGDLLPMPATLPDLPKIAAVGLVVVLIAAPKRDLPWPTAVLVALTCVIPAIAWGIMGPSPESDYAQSKALVLSAYVLPAVLFAPLLLRKHDLAPLAWAIASFGLVLGVVTLQTNQNVAGRAFPLEENPIWAARALGMAALAWWWLGNKSPASRTLVTRLAALFSFTALLYTGSRGPAAALVIALAGMLLSDPAKRSLKAISLGVVVILAATASLLLPPTGIPRALTALLQPLTGEATDYARIEMWQRSLSYMADNPIGAGLGNWRSSGAGYSIYKYPHDLYLEVGVEVGWAALAALVTVLGLTLLNLWRNSATSQTARLCLGLLTFNAICVAVSGDMAAGVFFGTLSIGLCYGSLKEGRENARLVRTSF